MQIKIAQSKVQPSHPKINWVDDVPYSVAFGDVYFSSEDGLAETRHVFLLQNRLQQRWQTLKSGHFTIVETGFGTGLNFLCAWQLWNETAPSTARLNFISIEKYPLSLKDIAKALDLWPQLSKECGQFLAQYHLLTGGFHRLVFDDGRIKLTLLIGDIADMLPQLTASVDAWFLDGFAPAKNPEMWQQALFGNMARLARAGTTFATFTSASVVRRGLEAAGFGVKKVAGFGRKREMLCGEYKTPLLRNSEGETQLNPELRSAIVIGGGISGCASAHALASRGWQICLIERHATLAEEASGNPVGVLYPRLSKKDNALSRLSLNGFLWTSRLLEGLGLNQAEYAQCGLLQSAFDARELSRCMAVAEQGLPTELVQFVDKSGASKLSGVDLMYGGLYFPSAGWVNPPAFCCALANHNNISLKTTSCALRLEKNGEFWQVWDKNNLLAEAPTLVIAGANDTANFKESAHLTLQPVRGQVTSVSATAASGQLKTIICTDGYITPQVNGKHCVGATFSPGEISTETRTSDDRANFAMLKRMMPLLHQALESQPVVGRAALRSATSDYLPLVGPLLDGAALKATPMLHHASFSNLPWLKGLYVNTGHGSKGLTTAPLCAEILASMICGEPLPVDTKLLAALNPNRDLLRQLGLKRLISNIALR